jgi:hypothetical protein
VEANRDESGYTSADDIDDFVDDEDDTEYIPKLLKPPQKSDKPGRKRGTARKSIMLQDEAIGATYCHQCRSKRESERMSCKVSHLGQRCCLLSYCKSCIEKR